MMPRKISVGDFLTYWEEGVLEDILHVPELKRYYARKNKADEKPEIVYVETPMS